MNTHNKHIHKDRNDSAGFTLIELLVVIAIIGILSSVVLASLNTARAKARDATRKSDIHQLYLAFSQYTIDNNGAPTVVAPACLGFSTGSTCWTGYSLNGGGYASISGNSALNTLLAPFIKSLPSDPSNSRTIGDAYVYMQGTADVHCNGTDSRTGSWIAWEPETISPTTDAQCSPGQIACCSWIGCGPNYFCVLKVD